MTIKRQSENYYRGKEKNDQFNSFLKTATVISRKLRSFGDKGRFGSITIILNHNL